MGSTSLGHPWDSLSAGREVCTLCGSYNIILTSQGHTQRGWSPVWTSHSSPLVPFSSHFSHTLAFSNCPQLCLQLWRLHYLHTTMSMTLHLYAEISVEASKAFLPESPAVSGVYLPMPSFSEGSQDGWSVWWVYMVFVTSKCKLNNLLVIVRVRCLTWSHGHGQPVFLSWGSRENLFSCRFQLPRVSTFSPPFSNLVAFLQSFLCVHIISDSFLLLPSTPMDFVVVPSPPGYPGEHLLSVAASIP